MTLALSATDLDRARDRGVRAALLGVRYRDQINYTQDLAKRWEGIDRECRSGQGQFPRNADCSGFASWVHWDATAFLDPHPDHVNGSSWRWGNTDSMIGQGEPVALSHLKRLDLVFYGRNSSGNPTHVAIYVGDGKVVSHGSQPGPFHLLVSYRDDLRFARRYLVAA